MRTDDGRIDHLQGDVAQSASGERLQDHIPDAAVGPPPKLPKDRVPVAEFLRQVAPRRSRSHQPKYRVEYATMVARPPTAAMDQERFEIRPLIVGHQSANQGRSPAKSSLESIHDSRVNRFVHATPYERICNAWADDPARFRYDPTHLISGLNT